MDSADNLSHCLRVLREALETLVYKLNVQQLMLVSNRPRHLRRAAEEVDTASDAVVVADVPLRHAASTHAEVLGLPTTSSLAELADVSPEPWRTLLAEHRHHLTRLRAEIDALISANQESARLYQSLMQETLPDGYDPHGAVTSLRSATPRFDQSV